MNQALVHSVLIVDDDPDDRESIRDAFLDSKHQHDYVLLNNGNQLIEHFCTDLKKNPSLILLDLNMPGMDGKDILKEIKANDSLKTIPVVVITTSSSPKDRETSYRLGANCFITKPNSYKELVEITDSIAKLWF